jgi:hypothetical protein
MTGFRIHRLIRMCLQVYRYVVCKHPCRRWGHEPDFEAFGGGRPAQSQVEKLRVGPVLAFRLAKEIGFSFSIRRLPRVGDAFGLTMLRFFMVDARSASFRPI